MKQESLKKFEGKKITIFLKNNLKYTNIFLKFEGDLIKFFDTREAEYLYLEPESILIVSKKEAENGN